MRRRSLFVAIDRCSRAVHLAVKADLTQQSAVAFLEEAVRAFPCRITIVLTDRGNSFAEGFVRAGQRLGIEHRMTRPYTPQTNGRGERFNGPSEATRIGAKIPSLSTARRHLGSVTAMLLCRRVWAPDWARAAA